MTTSRFLLAVQDLDQNGYPHLAGAALSYYDKQTQGMGIAQRGQVLAMFDEVLAKELVTSDKIDPTEIILSPDFVFLKALARTLQTLELDGEIIELTDVMEV
jgi:hypothetical protein